MSRRRKRSESLPGAFAGLALFLSGHLAGCGAEARQVPAVVAEERRSPDGVSLDPVSEPPAPTAKARAGEGLVVLRAPLGLDQALDTVERAFRLIVREDQPALVELFSGEATFVGGSGVPGRASSPPLDVFRQRLYKLDYTKLAGETIYRPGEIEIYRGSDEALPDWAEEDASLEPDDVVLRVPIATPKLGAERYFGAQVELHLRRAGQVYRIHRWSEDFQVP